MRKTVKSTDKLHKEEKKLDSAKPLSSTHENILGIFLVGIQVMICPQIKVPTPKKMHHSH